MESNKFEERTRNNRNRVAFWSRILWASRRSVGKVNRLAKKLLRSVIGTRNIDYDDFESLLYGASYMMNRRPITAASTDIDDTHVLTPAHFLYPYLYVDTTRHIVPPQTESYDCLRHGWRSTQFLLDEFWRVLALWENY